MASSTSAPADLVRRASIVWQPAAIAVLAFAVYVNALGNGFVYDDIYVTLGNPLLRDLRNVPELFRTSFWSGDLQPNYYRPLTNVLSLVAYAAFGRTPWGHHLVNVALHVATSVLVFLLARRAARTSAIPEREIPATAWVAGAVFAVHPIHTEAVTWIAGLPDLSYSFFYVLALLLFIGADEAPRSRLVASATAFFLSALCKEPGLTLPAIILGWDLAYRRSPWRARMWRYVPFAVAIAVYLALRLSALGGFAPAIAGQGGGMAAVKAAGLFVRYVGKLLVPTALNAWYETTPMPAAIGWAEAAALLTTLLLLLLAAWVSRRNKVAFLGVCLVAVPLLPALYTPWLLKIDFAERFLYLPCAGLALLLAAAYRAAAAGGYRRVAAVCAAALLVAYSVGTVARNRVWKDDFTLWSDVTEKSPGLSVPRTYVAYVLFKEGKQAEALAHYREALRLDQSGKVLETLNARGIESLRAGAVEDAIRHFQLVIQLDPTFDQAYSNLGVAHAYRGRMREAVDAFERAVELNPRNEASRANLERARSDLAAKAR
jgi:tetratricopeptide (TPR) repeat protein